MPGSKINKGFSNDPKSIWSPPYPDDAFVIQFKAMQAEDFVKIFTPNFDNSNITGRFLVRTSEIEGMTAEQIRKHLGLPDTPTHIQDVSVPAVTNLNTGVFGDQPKFTNPTIGSGGRQYQLLKEIDKNFFGDPRSIK